MVKRSSTFAGLLLLTACGGKVVVDGPRGGGRQESASLCLEACQQVVIACPGKVTESQCPEQCDQEEANADAASCLDQLRAYESCLAQHPQFVCSGSGCEAVFQAFGQCIHSHCQSQPDGCPL
jgi:hypothetical protein